MASQYEVVASDARGRNVKVLIESDSVRGARAKAKAQGLTPISVNVAEAGSPSSTNTSAFSEAIGSLGGIKGEEVSNMTRQLATLVKAHVPIVESLSAMVDQIEHAKLKQVLINMRQYVKEGRSLADGFALFPKIFDRVYINMVRAGESAGRLDVVLLRLADFSENRLKLKKRVTGALTYPLVMVVVGFLVLGVIFVKVIPQITKIFQDMKQALPLPTKILIAISEYAQEYVWHSMIAILIILWLLERFISTENGRKKKDRWILRMPVAKTLARNLAVARFARTLGTLLSSGVPMLGALQITRNVVGNSVFEDVVENAMTQVSEGRSLAYTLKQSGEFPPIVTHMVGVGEKTGELEGMLGNVADNYELQVESSLSTLTSLLEPIMIVFMAVLIGFIVMSVLLPIFEMNSFT